MQAVLTASGDATLRIWRAQDGSCLRTFVGHSSAVLRGRFIGVGSSICSTGSDGLIKVWSSQTGHCLFTEEAHQGKVWAMDAGGDGGSFAISGADDGSIVLWGDSSKIETAALKQQHEKDVEERQVCTGCMHVFLLCMKPHTKDLQNT